MTSDQNGHGHHRVSGETWFEEAPGAGGALPAQGGWGNAAECSILFLTICLNGNWSALRGGLTIQRRKDIG